MRTITSSVEIPASAAEVWAVLVATDQYAQWNPFMARLEGPLEAGGSIVVSIRPGRRAMTFRPTIVALVPGHLIRWQGKAGVRGIFDGEHELRVDPLPGGGSKFTQHEVFTGILVPLMRKTLEQTEQGFAAMNLALSARTLAIRDR